MFAFSRGHAGAAAGCCRVQVLLEGAAVRVACALWSGYEAWVLVLLRRVAPRCHDMHAIAKR